MKLESVAKKLFVGTGVVLSAAVALTPLASHAKTVVSYGTNPDGTSYTNCIDDDAGSLTEDSTIQCDFAVKSANNSVQNGMEVAFNVQPTISIDALAQGSPDPIVLSPTTIRTGEITSSVTANTAYALLLSAKAEDGTAMTHEEKNTTSLIPATDNLQDGTAGWAIMNEISGQYKGITTNPVRYFESTNTRPITDDEHTFTVGIAASKNLASGIYTATVVVTAAAK